MYYEEYLKALLRRLEEERGRLGYTQAELGRILSMSQGHYSKTETGKNRFTFEKLKYLLKAGFDLHYVFTGERISHPEYYEFFINCAPAKMRCLAEAALSLIELSLILQKGAGDILAPFWDGKDILARIKNVKCLLIKDRQEDSAFYQLRRYKAYTQQYMAEILGLSIRKYAALEKQECFGDSEIIWKMYNIFQISPLLLLGDEAGLAREICSLLEHLDEAECEKTFECIKAMYDKMRR